MSQSDKESAQRLYNMDLFDRVTTEDVVITRVPGGWIYESGVTSQTCCFIPFNNEFMPVDVADFSSDFDDCPF